MEGSEEEVHRQGPLTARMHGYVTALELLRDRSRLGSECQSYFDGRVWVTRSSAIHFQGVFIRQVAVWCKVACPALRCHGFLL